MRFFLGICEWQGPFDGVLGFSQGASMCALLSAVSAPPQPSDATDAFPSYAPAAGASKSGDASGDESTRNPLTFRFALMFGGFVPRSHDVRFLFDPPSPSLARIRSLHVFGMF